jgi:hypothetical protein
MRFSEVFLRLGCSLVAWMVLYTYFVWLAALHAMGCGPDGNEMHQLLLGMAPVSTAFVFMLKATRPFAEIHRILLWLAVPLALLLPVVLRNVWRVLSRSNLHATAICFDRAPAGWELAWAPAQLLAIAAVSLVLLTAWRDARRSGTQDGASS